MSCAQVKLCLWQVGFWLATQSRSILWVVWIRWYPGIWPVAARSLAVKDTNVIWAVLRPESWSSAIFLDMADILSGFARCLAFTYKKAGWRSCHFSALWILGDHRLVSSRFGNRTCFKLLDTRELQPAAGKLRCRPMMLRLTDDFAGWHRLDPPVSSFAMTNMSNKEPCNCKEQHFLLE